MMKIPLAFDDLVCLPVLIGMVVEGESVVACEEREARDKQNQRNWPRSAQPAENGRLEFGHRTTLTRAASQPEGYRPVSYTHLRAHETPEHLVCRLLLE